MLLAKSFRLNHFFHQKHLVSQIFVGLLCGIALAWFSPTTALSAGLFGELFLNALKAIAPILVFLLVVSAITNHKTGQKTNIKPIIVLYLIGTFLAASVAVGFSVAFPSSLTLLNQHINISAPESVNQVLKQLLFNIIENPVSALLNANFIGILAWAIALGFFLRHTTESTQCIFNDLSHAITSIVKVVIRFAPIGIFGLTAYNLANTGFIQLLDYLHLLIVLVSCMVIVTFVINPLLVFLTIRRNPYPLVFTCLRESGITAFFTRSSAANVPINLALCKKLNLHEDTYSISIPLGATINMAGAAITITVLTLAAVHTLQIEISIITAFLLSLLATLCACGASGVAGGSLLLIPLACSLFNIPIDTAMQVVSIGFTIGIIQDSVETAVNSSTDVLFTAAVCLADEQSNAPIPKAG